MIKAAKSILYFVLFKKNNYSRTRQVFIRRGGLYTHNAKEPLWEGNKLIVTITYIKCTPGSP